MSFCDDEPEQFEFFKRRHAFSFCGASVIFKVFLKELKNAGLKEMPGNGTGVTTFEMKAPNFLHFHNFRDQIKCLLIISKLIEHSFANGKYFFNSWEFEMNIYFFCTFLI